MEMNFPSSPTDGQIYGNFIWSAATGAWLARPQPQSVAVSSPTAPTSPVVNTLWYNTNDGNTYIYNYDGDSYQWVQLKSDATLSSTLGSRVDALDYGANVNYIINGAFDFWQRGTSFTPASGSIVYLADRWFTYRTGTGATVTVSQQSFTPGSAPVSGYEYPYFLRYAQTVAGTGGDANNISQRIEDVRTLAGQTAIISFWAKADAVRTITPMFYRNFGTGGSASDTAVTGVAITISTSWARYTQAISIPTVSGKTIGAGSFIEAALVLSFNTAQTIDIFGVQLQQGPTATAFHRAMPTLAGELASCQRYYEKSYDLTTAPGTVTEVGAHRHSGSGNAAGRHYVPIRFKVEKRNNAYSVNTYNPTAANPNWITVNSAQTGIARTPDIEQKGTSGMTLNVEDGGYGWYPGNTRGHWVVEAEL